MDTSKGKTAHFISSFMFQWNEFVFHFSCFSFQVLNFKFQLSSFKFYFTWNSALTVKSVVIRSAMSRTEWCLPSCWRWSWITVTPFLLHDLPATTDCSRDVRGDNCTLYLGLLNDCFSLAATYRPRCHYGGSQRLTLRHREAKSVKCTWACLTMPLPWRWLAFGRKLRDELTVSIISERC